MYAVCKQFICKEQYQVQTVVPLHTLHSKRSILALPENIRLGCMRLIVTSTLAYVGTELIPTVKKVSGTISITLCFLCNLRRGPIS